MSLWTPGGERPVERQSDSPGGSPAGAPPAGAGAGPGAGAPVGPDGQPLTPEQAAEAQQIAAEMAQVREQLSQVPAAQVVANHAMGCYELAAIHLSAQPPRLGEAQVAIDAFGALTEVLTGKLGEDEATLADALAQLRMAFVQIQAGMDEAGAEGGGDAEAPATEG